MITPLQTYSLTEIGFGPAVLLIGILALLLWAAVVFRNPLAVFMWVFALILFIFSGLFGIGIELFWIAILLTGIIISIGVIARWSQ